MNDQARPPGCWEQKYIAKKKKRTCHKNRSRTTDRIRMLYHFQDEVVSAGGVQKEAQVWCGRARLLAPERCPTTSPLRLVCKAVDQSSGFPSSSQISSCLSSLPTLLCSPDLRVLQPLLDTVYTFSNMPITDATGKLSTPPASNLPHPPDLVTPAPLESAPSPS